MTTSSDLPRSLPEAFTVAQARDAGVSPGRLRGRDLSRPFHGVRARAEPTPGSLEASCRALLPRLRNGQFFSHETALSLLGVPLPEWPYAPSIHVSTHRPAREPRTHAVVGHRLQLRESAHTTVRGMPVEHPARASRQTGTLWRLDDLVAAADHLISGRSPLTDAAELRREIEVMGDVRGGILRRALALARGGVRSPRETRLRLLLSRAGLPDAEVAWNLFDDRGTFVAELDLAFPRYRLAVEYDGRVHAYDARQFARDADRWAAIRGLGWQHERVLAHHLVGDGRLAVSMVRDALQRAGWTPGR